MRKFLLISMFLALAVCGWLIYWAVAQGGGLSSETRNAVNLINKWEANHPEKHVRTSRHSSNGQLLSVDMFYFKEQEKLLWRMAFKFNNPRFEYIIFPYNRTNFAYFPVSGLLVAQSNVEVDIEEQMHSLNQTINLQELERLTSKVSVRRKSSESELILEFDSRNPHAVRNPSDSLIGKRRITRIFFKSDGRLVRMINQVGNIESYSEIEYVSLDPKIVRNELPQILAPNLVDSTMSFTEALREEIVVTKKKNEMVVQNVLETVSTNTLAPFEIPEPYKVRLMLSEWVGKFCRNKIFQCVVAGLWVCFCSFSFNQGFQKPSMTIMKRLIWQNSFVICLYFGIVILALIFLPERLNLLSSIIGLNFLILLIVLITRRTLRRRI